LCCGLQLLSNQSTQDDLELLRQFADSNSIMYRGQQLTAT